MRMTREAYAKEVLKTVEAVLEGEKNVCCPHENCDQPLQSLNPSMQAGMTIKCPLHGIIYHK